MIKKHRNLLFPVLLVMILFLLPNFLRPYTIHIFCLTFLWVMIASAWNIIGGFGGQLSIGHVAFLGTGAYTSSLLYTQFGISPWLGMIAGGLIAVALAAFVSWPVLRLKGPFFTLATIAFGQIVLRVAIHWRGLTGGSVGLSIPFEPAFANMTFRGREPYYYLFLVFALFIVLVCYKIQASKLGFYLSAVREDEEAAESLGVPTTGAKLTAMLISAFITAMAGSLYAQYLFYIDPHTVLFIMLSVQMVIIAAIGGLGTWQGPILGAFLIIPLGEYLRSALGTEYQGLHFVFFGILLMLVVIFIPEGLFEWLKKIIKLLIDYVTNKVSLDRP